MMLTREPENSPLLEGLIAIGRTFKLLLLSAVGLPFILIHKDCRQSFMQQLYIIGIGSLPVATVVAVFTGMILSLQLGIAFKPMSQELMVAYTLAFAMLREMGPFMTGIILASCVGSSMAAQLGTMAVNEEVAALEMMGINPIRFLVTPRLWAMVIMAPFISFYTSLFAFIGGGLISMTQLNISFLQFMQEVIRAAAVKDLYVGLFKALIFGAIICAISCSIGFSTRQGAAGVGASTRKSVILSFLSILVFGYFITRLFYVL